jgi:hypothetical protein
LPLLALDVLAHITHQGLGLAALDLGEVPDQLGQLVDDGRLCRGLARLGSPLDRVAAGQTVLLELLEHEVHQAPEVVEGPALDDALAVGLVDELGVRLAADLDEADDLVVAQTDRRIVDPALVEAKPVIVRLAVGPHAKCIAVDADAGPLLEPGPDVPIRADLGDRGRLEVEGEQPHLDGAAGQRAGAVPHHLPRCLAVDPDADALSAVEGRLELVRRLRQVVGRELPAVVREVVRVHDDLEGIGLVEGRAEALQPQA